MVSCIFSVYIAKDFLQVFVTKKVLDSMGYTRDSNNPDENYYDIGTNKYCKRDLGYRAEEVDWWIDACKGVLKYNTNMEHSNPNHPVINLEHTVKLPSNKVLQLSIFDDEISIVCKQAFNSSPSFFLSVLSNNIS